MLIIDDVKNKDILHPRGMGKGLVLPPDAERRAMFAPPIEMRVYPESDMEDIVREMWDRKTTLWHIWQEADNGKQPPILNQGRYGYCWAHSTVNALMLQRARDNMPYVPLSAFHVAATIKNGRNEGGWCGQSAKFVAERGVCSQELWPQGDANPRRRNQQEVDENAKLHRITEEWRDDNRPIYGQRLNKQQLMTSLINLHPAAMDDMDWAHSVCGAAPVVIERGSLGIMFLNSWINWGDNGFAVKRYENVASDGAISIMSSTASAA